MSLIIIGSAIGVILLIVIIVNAVSQRRDQVAAQKRQEAAKYRFRATETQDLLDGLKNISLSPKIRSVLVQRMIENLETAETIASDYPGIKRSIEFAKNEKQELDKQTSFHEDTLILPNSEGELKSTISKLKRLLKMVNVMYQRGRMNSTDFAIEVPRVELLLLKLEVETYIKFGRVAQAEGRNGSAKQFYQVAYEQLIQKGISTEYAQEKMVAIQQLIDEVSPHIDIPEEKDEDKAKQDDLDIVFGQKKKWD